MEERIAAIVVNYNGIKDTIECINSLRESTVDVEIIVVDNGSKDEEVRQLETINPITLIKEDVNLGFAGANNTGIKYALKKGYDKLLLINNDTVCLPNMIEQLISDYDESCVYVPYIYYYSNQDLLWYGGGKINKSTGNVEHFTSHKENPFFCNYASGCCMLLNKSIIKKIGLLPEEYFMYCEDMDYCLNMLKNKVRIKCIPNSVLYHKVGASSGGNESAFSVYYITRNRLHCVKKYKSVFWFTAYPFSVVSRVLRMLNSAIKNKKEVSRAFKEGIIDHKKQIFGKVK